MLAELALTLLLPMIAAMPQPVHGTYSVPTLAPVYMT